MPLWAASALLWATCILWASCAAPHPYHTSFAEVDWSDAGDALEISLRVLPEDLETALTWRSGQAIVLGQAADDDALVSAYLREHFQVRDGGGHVLPLALAGMEVAYDETWVHFTVTANPAMRLTLRNTVLMDIDSTQTNRVQPLWAAPEATLVLTSARPEQVLWRGR